MTIDTMRRGRFVGGIIVIFASTGLWVLLEDPEQAAPARTAGLASSRVTAVKRGDHGSPRVSGQPIGAPPPLPSSDVSDAAWIMEQIRGYVREDARLAETLALEHEQRFPNSPDADERDMLFVSAIFNQGNIDRARYEARRYYRRHPGGRYTEYLIKQLNIRPPPPPPPASAN
jgi:hypothetical protein